MDWHSSLRVVVVILRIISAVFDSGVIAIRSARLSVVQVASEASGRCVIAVAAAAGSCMAGHGLVAVVGFAICWGCD